MKKVLSDTQQKVLDSAIKRYFEAKNLTYDEWILKTQSHGEGTIEEYKFRCPDLYEGLIKYWEKGQRGLVLVISNTKTIKKLQGLGYLTIVEIGGSHCDWVQLNLERLP